MTKPVWFLADGTPLIEDCACGRDHQTMPMIDVSSCACAWSHDPDPDCDHAAYLTPGVCLKHKRHEPCRPCMHEERERERDGKGTASL